MTDPQRRDLANGVEAAVRAVPGVYALFPAGGLAGKAIDIGSRLIGVRAGDASLVRVESTDGEELHVDIAVGVREHAGTVATARRVQHAARSAIAERRSTRAQIRITVVHIENSTDSEDL